MTDITAGRLQRVSKVIVHPLTVRITHWLNALAIVIMIMSGWRIYNSDPIFPFYFPVDLTLGGSYDGSVDLHNEDGLAGALQWHFAGMWLLTINGIVYLAYGIVSGHFRRSFFPVGPSAFLRDTVAALQVSTTASARCLQCRAEDALSRCAGCRRDHGAVRACDLEARPVPGADLAVRRLRRRARDPFLGMVAIVLFLIVHVALVIIVPKTLPTMITGRAPAHEAPDHKALGSD